MTKTKSDHRMLSWMVLRCFGFSRSQATEAEAVTEVGGKNIVCQFIGLLSNIPTSYESTRQSKV